MKRFNPGKTLLAASMALCAVGAAQAVELAIKPVISVNELFAVPSEIRVKLFNAREGGQFLQEQIFKAGEWTSGQDLSRGLPPGGKLDLNMAMEVPDDLQGQQLWAEVSIDGRVVGSRLAASAANTRFTINGDIVLNKEGGDNTDPADNTGRINFPDGTSMGSINDVPGDNLGDHTATQNINLGTAYVSPDGGGKGLLLGPDGRLEIGITSTAANGLNVWHYVGGVPTITYTTKNGSSFIKAETGFRRNAGANDWYVDVNGDGSKELVVQQGDNGTDFLWLNANIRQRKDEEGLVKAAVYLECGASTSVIRHFSYLGAVTAAYPTGAPDGTCEITFGGTDPLLSRYWTVTPVTTNDNNQDNMRVAQCRKIGHTKLRCNRFAADGSGDNGRLIVTVF